MRRFLWPALAGVVALLCLGIAGLPARLLPIFLADQPVFLGATAGTVWRGRAARVIVQSDAGPVHLGAVQWRLSPFSLLLFSPELSLSSEWGDQRGTARVRARGERIEMRDVDVALGADIAKQFLPVDLDGRLQLIFDELVVDGGMPETAEGRAVWQEAAWMGPGGRRPLGAYVAEFTSSQDSVGDSDNPPIALTITTLSGAVRAEGQGELTDATYRLELRIESDRFDEQLSQALELIAAPQDNGYLLRLDGTLN